MTVTSAARHDCFRVSSVVALVQLLIGAVSVLLSSATCRWRVFYIAFHYKYLAFRQPLSIDIKKTVLP